MIFGKVEHEGICQFRPYSCPCPGSSCEWEGHLDQIMAHMKQVSLEMDPLFTFYFMMEPSLGAQFCCYSTGE